ncbi:Lovastatin nonaketide synthase-like protein [Emericellopsis cladophorae]|uniref:Lovastatin nonaketide synthase-like protein n=1 Tax=Emericellopsis cladophorae TaxID=2686198 RepID=A0A9Q0BH89_9HYPO|nr:Lovastatin nonaketide synthase-like protein [Emericellopsis cladophorae]KAI6785287.1 Lovastatin nonaketide synthase-like protein [Emericellopsis cladophorae]
MSMDTPHPSPIAVIGLSYRAPGVGRKGLWDYLAEAKSAWSTVPPSRFDYDAYHHPDKDKAGCIAAAGGHFLPEDEDIYTFDAPFFNLRPEEARAVDPHHRMLLECALEAAESAGVTLPHLAGSNTGVFSAIGSPEHGHMLGEDMPASSTWTCAGGAPCMFANRLSYFFDLHGPSIALDAACASSTYAVHMACQSLRAGECDIQAGDPIHAIIRNSACNHGGRSDGITMPRQSAQEQLLWRVHREVGLSPNETPVVEGHGTGTRVGDPIEAGSFVNVLATRRGPDNPLYIGSLKSNFGHLEGASGILGMIKAIMMLQNGHVLPNAGFERFNRSIKGSERLRVAPTKLPWPAHEPRRVCVTNFGFGGSNSAIVMDEGTCTTSKLTNGDAATQNGVHHGPKNRVFVFSAKSESSLSAYLLSFKEYLEGAVSTGQQWLDNLAFTLGEHRTHHSYRAAVTAASLGGLKTQVSTAKPRKSRERTVCFVFTGQGAQHAQMAMALRVYHVFAAALDEAEAILTKLGATWSLKEELARPPDETRINEAEISQPACTAVQLALVALLRSWGVEPTAVTGHSSGEIGAAFAASLASFESAIAMAYFRGRATVQLVQDKNLKGAMLALGAGSEAANGLLEPLDQEKEGYVTIAAINSPSSVTVSGDEAAVDKIHELAKGQGVFARKLNVDVAYHSRHMERVADTYRAAIEPYCTDSPSVDSVEPSGNLKRPRFVSSSSPAHNKGGDSVTTPLDASYWVNNLVKPVRFAEAVEKTLDMEISATRLKPSHVIVEIGPHSALKGPVQQIVDRLRERQKDQKQQKQVSYLSSLERGTDAHEAILNLAKGLFTLGVPVSPGAVNQTNGEDRGAQIVTDLPPYAWDRAVQYMLRSRITQAKLHPGQPYHPLLGWKSPYDEGNETSFRQVFTLDEMPWIREHAVGGQVIFPMTGYLALGMEALRRVHVASASPSNKGIGSLVVSEFHAKRSLEVDEDERVDLTTKVRPASSGTEIFSSTSWVFEVWSWSQEYGWTSHAHGQLEIEGTEPSAYTQTLQASLPLTDTRQLQERDPEAEYHKDHSEGTTYGPAFKRMRRFWEGPGFTVMETELRELDVIAASRSPFGSPVCVDTPTLDSFLQGLGPLLEAYGEKPAMMPNYVSRLRIANNIPADPGLRLTVVTRLLDYDLKAGLMRISVAAFQRGDNDISTNASSYSSTLTPVVEFESVSLRVVASGSSGNTNAGSTSSTSKNIPASYFWDLIPSLRDLSDNDKLREFLQVGPTPDAERERVHVLNQAAIHFMQQALEATRNEELNLPPHLARFHTWAVASVERAKDTSLLEGVDTASLVKTVASSGGQGEMVCAVGEQLSHILRGELQALEIMLKDNRLARYYDDDLTNVRLSHVLATWVRHQCDVKSSLRVLEIGAGTGSATLPVFEAISRGQERLPDDFHYTYTDISSGFFESARAKLAKWAPYITYQKLDVSRDPAQQDFTLQEYDLVIASNVLHATADMAATVDHVRSLLKPNGQLVVLEAGLHAPLVLPFALLPGWWLAEDEYRKHEEGPLLSADAWGGLFADRGFSGVDGVIEGYPGDPNNILSIITTTRVGLPEVIDSAASVTVCGPMLDDDEVEFAQTVADLLAENLGCQTEVKPFAEVEPDDDPFCVFIDSSSGSIWNDVSDATFDKVRDLFLRVRGMLWVIPENHGPDADTVKGILRTVRLELGSRNLFLLEDLPCTQAGAPAIAQLSERLRDSENESAVDFDFTWRDGTLWLPRYRALPEAKEVFAAEAGIETRKEQALGHFGDDVALEMTVEAAGSPDSIYFQRSDALQQPLADDAILVKVEASGVNFRDLLLVLGSIPWTRPGFEGAGVVLRTGSAVKDLRPGDKVFYGALHGGSFATHIQMPSWHATKLPEDRFTMAQSAGLSVAYSTAVMSIIRIGRLRPGETVLIHAASGAVGQACIVLAQHIGADVYVTVGTPAKRWLLHKEFDIPEDHIFSSRTNAFRDGIMAKTQGHGIDLVVNSLSGALLQATWAIVADFGRFVEIGKRDALQNSHLPMRPFDRNVTFTGVDLRTMFLSRPHEHRSCLGDINDLVARGVVKPICPVTEMPVSQLGAALRRLQSGQNLGKIVITMDPDARVVAQAAPPRTLQGSTGQQLLRPDKTYVITGGTGGIGLSLGPWMVEHGAKNIVLLGRSGASRQPVQQVLARYQDTDVSMRAIACDVGDRDDVASVVDAIKDLPPVGGVIHGALFLKDKLLSNTSHQDWLNIVLPRIRGAWNLHEVLPNNLDFFVVLSSFISGSGNMGQSVYSGTASFYDTFAEYRSAMGQPTVSVALPVVLDVGYVADRDLEGKLTNALGAVLSLEDLQTVIKGTIVGASSGLHRDSKAISFSYARGDDSSILPWQCFHPRALVDYIRSGSRANGGTVNGVGDGSKAKTKSKGLELANESDPLAALLATLMDRVSTITMIERDEMDADAPLSNYSLDSLVSVELRNWIKRATNVDLSLPKIVNAANLRSLATLILSQREAGMKKQQKEE